MMYRRIFIAINLPENIKKKLAAFQEQFLGTPAKWTRPDNFHITLLFLGNVQEEEIPQIIEKVQAATESVEAFTLDLNRITFFPEQKIPPRMIWARGEPVEELTALQKKISSSLSQFSEVADENNKNFTPHITLARVNQWEFRQIDPEEREVINEDIFLKIPVNSIEIMESELRKGGSAYSVLQSFNLQI